MKNMELLGASFGIAFAQVGAGDGGFVDEADDCAIFATPSLSASRKQRDLLECSVAR